MVSEEPFHYEGFLDGVVDDETEMRKGNGEWHE